MKGDRFSEREKEHILLLTRPNSVIRGYELHQVLRVLQDILADINHNLGQPILGTRVIGNNLIFPVILIHFTPTPPVSPFCMCMVVIMQSMHSVGMPDRKFNPLL
jgi:hypothetical protein